jgi:malonyl-CoA O-methyltransferase
MNPDKFRLGHNFGRQAAQYDRYALVQRRLAEELVQSLRQDSRKFAHILEIGCGTGYLTGLLRQTFPGARITALDLAPAALEAARTRLVGSEGIEWLVADGEQSAPGRFDLITSSSVFQWFSQPRQACRLYWEHLEPEGILAFATLGPLTFRELAASFQEAGARLPEVTLPVIPAQNFAAGGDWGNFLQQAGFADIAWEEELWLEGYADPWAFLRAVRGMGATSTRPTFLPRRLLAAVVNQYEKRFRRNGTIQVTYEIIRARGKKSIRREVRNNGEDQKDSVPGRF